MAKGIIYTLHQFVRVIINLHSFHELGLNNVTLLKNVSSVDL